MTFHESWVERQIREATERGEFDNLPGAGKPLNLGDVDDPEWWTKRYLAREGLDASATMPPVMQLRAEHATLPESLLDLANEDAVREVLADYNRRVVEDRLRPVLGKSMPAVAPRVDIDEMVQRWRDARQVATLDVAPAEEPGPDPVRPRRWLRRFWRRSSPRG